MFSTLFSPSRSLAFILVMVMLLVGLAAVGCLTGSGDDDSSHDDTADDDDDASESHDDNFDDDTTSIDDDTDSDDDADDDGGSIDNGSLVGGDVYEETWTDFTTQLTWEVKPPNDPYLWKDAKIYCENLVLDGGGWRLPTISELRSIIRGCARNMTGGECGISDECPHHDCSDYEACRQCAYLRGPGPWGLYWPDELNGHVTRYWSSTEVLDDPPYIWCGLFDIGALGAVESDFSDGLGVRCVRNAP
ncbi:DUF1566 domain-containing protein [bacterium]|nr:DUF1566 domain-containing protein [bacterium]